MQKARNTENGYFARLGRIYEDSEKGWENYWRDWVLADLYGDWDLDRRPWAWGHLRGGLDYVAAEIGPEKAILELRDFLDYLNDPEKCGWLEMHRAGMFKTEGLKLAGFNLPGDACKDTMH